MKSTEKTMLLMVLLGVIGLAVVLGIFLKSGEEEGPESQVALTESLEKVGSKASRSVKDGVDFSQVSPLGERETVAPIRDQLARSEEGPAAAAPEDRGVVKGRILNEFNQPLAKAEVKLALKRFSGLLFSTDNEAANPLRAEIDKVSTLSGKDGRFKLEGAWPESRLQLQISRHDCVTRSLPLKNFDGKELDMGDLILEMGGSISGYIRNESGQGLAQAKIQAQPVDEGSSGSGITFFSFSTDLSGHGATTEGDGFFRITGLPEGKVDLYVSHDQYQFDGERDVVVKKGRETSNIQITLEEGFTIAGHVYDKDENPVQGARVSQDRTMINMDMSDIKKSLPALLMKSPSAKTDEKGYFQLTGLEEGKHTLRVRAPGFLPYSQGGVKAGAQDLIALLSKGGWVAGVVKDGRTGQPIENFDLQVQSMDFRQPTVKILKGREAVERISGALDPRGAYYVEGMPEKPCKLAFTAEGYADLTIPNVTAGAGKGNSLDPVLWPEARVAGLLLDPSGQPVEGGQVELRTPKPRSADGGMRIRKEIRIEDEGGFEDLVSGNQWKKRVNSKKDGSYEILGIPEGAYELVASHDDYVDSAPRSVRLGKGEQKEALEITLGLAGTVAGTVFGVDGEPKPGAHLQARAVGSSPMGWKQSVADRSGDYRIKGLAPGEYFVKLSADPGNPGFMLGFVMNGEENDVPGAAKVLVEAGEESRLDLFETRKCSVEGRVLEAGTGVAGMKVRLFKAEGMIFMPLRTAQTDEDGFFLMKDIESGAYTLDVELRGVPNDVEEKITLAAGDLRQVDFELPAGRISGRITDLDTDEPVAGVQVSLERFQEEEPAEEEGESGQMMITINAETSSDSGGEMIQAFTIGGGAGPITTDKEGYYEIAHVRAGEYNLSAEGGGHAKKKTGPVKVEEGEHTMNQDLAVERGYQISGALRNRTTGEAVGYTPVWLDKRNEKTKEWEEETTAFAEEDGAFTFKDLKSGNYRLRMEGGTYKGMMEIFVTTKNLEDLFFDLEPI